MGRATKPELARLELMYQPAQIAIMYQLCIKTIRREIARGHLRAEIIGSDLRVTGSALAEWRSNNQVKEEA